MSEGRIMINELPKCPKCQSTLISKHFPRLCKFKITYVFRCNICGTKFSIDPTTGMLSTGKNRSLFPYSLIQECITLRKDGKKIREIKEQILKEFGIQVGKRTIQTWLKNWREKLQQCELSPWEEIVGVLIKIEKSKTEEKLTLYANRMLFVISLPKKFAKCRNHLGKRIAILKTDIPEKPFIIRVEKMRQKPRFFI